MPKQNAKMQSWRIFHYARKYLGRQKLYSIFGKRHARSVDAWCEDPRSTDRQEGAFDPIRGVRNLLWLLDDDGHTGICRAALQYLASGTSVECGVDWSSLDEPPDSSASGLLEGYRKMAELHAAIDAGVEPEQLLAIKRAIVSEIELTIARYHSEWRQDQAI